VITLIYNPAACGLQGVLLEDGNEYAHVHGSYFRVTLLFGSKSAADKLPNGSGRCGAHALY
jgi:hypothetical protein